MFVVSVCMLMMRSVNTMAKLIITWNRRQSSPCFS